MASSPWNSLEVLKLAIASLTPLLVLILGIRINNSVKAAERSTSLRSEIYQRIGGDLNDIYAYLAFVGGWKAPSPPEVIARKRAVDKAMYTYRPFFSPELFASYRLFMNEAFEAHGRPGEDARIRSSVASAHGDRAVHATAGWEPAWAQCFTGETNVAAQREAYERFLVQLARDLKI